MINLESYFDAMRLAHNGKLPLNLEQEKALRHDYQAPLWIIAGPGSGKTHTLVWLVLKRILVDGVPIDRIILTTFTRKAAAELESRLIQSQQKLVMVGLQAAKAIDVSQINVGTLHGLCASSLQDHRYEPTLRIRVLEDELTQQFFIRRSNNPLLGCDDLAFWMRFGLHDSWGGQPQVPNKAKKAEGICKLFNRLTENSVDVAALFQSGDPDFERIADAYWKYQEKLVESHRTDQAHLQQHFLNFLQTVEGKAWLAAGFTVLVDEYQDTNPIQEQIYFALAGTNCDLTVVGDDDQSLYRFRGATVEALIDFDRACQIYLGQTPSSIYLAENRRSHPQIVAWVNRYIEQHPAMRHPQIRVRAPYKPSLVAKADIRGAYPAILTIAEKDGPKGAQKLRNLILGLKNDGLIEDYSQIAILTFSTRESSHAIGTYVNQLRDVSVPLYNPRNKSAQKDQRFKAMIGGLCMLLDVGFDVTSLPAQLPGSVIKYVNEARNEFQALLDQPRYAALGDYVNRSLDAISTSTLDPSKSINYLKRSGGRNVTLAGLLYKLLAYEPFADDLADAEGGERLKALNLVLAEYESLYDDGQLRLAQSPFGDTVIDKWTRYNFYAIFIEGIHDGLNDPEDDEVSVQDGAVNVMTIHQSKGLEFEVVIVLRPDKYPWEGDTHILEDVFDPFVTRPTKPPLRRSRAERAQEDAVRLFYVAHSRAKRLLVLAGYKLEEWDIALGRDVKGQPINTLADLQAAGVRIL